MKTPAKGSSPAAYDEGITKWLEDNCKKSATTDEGVEWKCKKCGDDIMAVDCCVSIHYKDFGGCAGGGQVQHINIPYCPTCEEKPETSSCVHVSM